jgi:hypothetical protein
VGGGTGSVAGTGVSVGADGAAVLFSGITNVSGKSRRFSSQGGTLREQVRQMMPSEPLYCPGFMPAEFTVRPTSVELEPLMVKLELFGA